MYRSISNLLIYTENLIILLNVAYLIKTFFLQIPLTIYLIIVIECTPKINIKSIIFILGFGITSFFATSAN